MSILARFLTRMILLRFIVILLGLSAFVLTLEVVGFLTDVLHIHPNPLAAVGLYCAARLPGILNLFLPTSLLLALLLAMTELSYRNELTAIWATGVSPARLILKLLPMALAIGLFQFMLMEKAVPYAATTLHGWGIGDYATRKFKTAENEALWIRSGNDIMRAEQIAADGKTLEKVTLFRREPGGQLLQEVFAETASQVSGEWLLNNATIYYATGQAPSRTKQLTYSGVIRFANTKLVTPEEMPLSELSVFSANNGFGVRPAYAYDVWWQKRLTPFLVAVAMLALCVPLGTKFRRGGGLGAIFMVGVALGFVYFVGDGLVTTLGETGTLSPFLAAWGLPLLFGALAVALLTRTDHV